MKLVKTLLVAGALVVSGAAANAASIFADTVVDYTQGFCTGGPADCSAYDPTRYDENNALGSPDGVFTALGFGGSIEVTFAGAPFPGGTATSYEITTNRNNDHDEAAEIYAVLGGVVSPLLGVITNSPSGESSVIVNGAFDSILIVDITKTFFGSTTSFDGFDVDAIGISAVPLPATALMLLAGVGGLGMMRRKKS
ncbi:VPLPA-CTERM sorting domain-containing protein [Tropicimonas sp. S265A]|uniref:VPLPA-CTERM sorting domain-containing protein n=1 Tax=Tropicimonas sp. S265A TaxID=3415134 RepID=UPI003C7BD8C8